MNAVAIRTENLSRSFQEVKAVDRISFVVPSGIIFGFLGPNGSGKSTTIRLLLGLLEPSGGRAEVLGFDISQDSGHIREQSGALLEHTGLYERLSAFENLAFFARIWRLSGRERSIRIQELLESLDLWERRNEPVGSWSRGMKQKLAVARCLLHKPRLVFLDEPTAGLDPVATNELYQSLNRMVQDQGVTVFLTTNNLAEAEKRCARVAVIRQGGLQMVGSPDELRTQKSKNRLEVTGHGFTQALFSALSRRPETEDIEWSDKHLFLKLRENADTSGLVSFLVSQGVQIEEVRKGKQSLEDVFLSLMEEENGH